MIDSFFHALTFIDKIFWGYFAFLLIMVIGLFLTIKTGFFQIRFLPHIIKIFFHYLSSSSDDKRGVHPLKVFFASTGGMIGIGNIVGIVTAVQIGGPGALFWVWVAGMIGAILKYCEIYLGLKFRQSNEEGGYDGGPMHYLRKAFSNKVVPIVVAVLLCVYGIEIYQFTIITNSVSSNWHIDRLIVMFALLGFIFYAVLGGVERIGQICSWVMPLFLFIYIVMGFWVIGYHVHDLPAMMKSVFISAFTGHAAVGGFAGSTIILAIQHGIARAAYSSDIGVGFDSIIQSESSSVYPRRQAGLAILGVFIDNTICSMSILVVLLSGVWKSLEPIEASNLVQSALSNYFPYMEYFIPFFYIVTGYTTIIAYFVVGMKCARYLSPKWGKGVYVLYGVFSFIFFTFAQQSHALVIMSVSGAILFIINIFGIFRLRKEIVFYEK